MSLGVAAGDLRRSWERLQACWIESVSVWDDSQRWHFEAEYWNPLRTQTPATLQALDRLAETVAEVQRMVRMP